MATFSIISPKYSFVNFNPQNDGSCCIGEKEICLPVVEDNDLIFQFSIITDTIEDATDVFNSPLSGIQLLLLDVDGAEIHNWTLTDTLLFEKYRTGPNKVTYLWRNSLLKLTPSDLYTSLLACDKCFSLKIKATVTINAEEITRQALSNCFIVRCSDCYTSLFEYYNDENYAEFEYCNMTNSINRVRLFVHFNQPKTIEDKAIYRKSNGAIKQTRSLITKEYQAQTEHFPESIHDKITIMLAHDTVQVISAPYTGGISKSGEYDIEWIDNLCKATAKFKATATPFAIRNNNCADCAELVLCSEINGINGVINYDDVTDEWSVDLSGISWLNLPTTGANIGVKFSFREFVSGGGGAFTDIATVMINHLGQIVSTPTVINTGLLNEAWASVEIRATVLCNLESGNNNFAKVFNNPQYATCNPITNLSISVLGTSSALAQWNPPTTGLTVLATEIILFEAQTPGTPVAGYPILLPGNPIQHTFTGLTSGTDYQFAIRIKCGTNSFSQWTDLPEDPDFTTL